MSLMHDVRCVHVFCKVSSLSLVCFQFLAPGGGSRLRVPNVGSTCKYYNMSGRPSSYSTIAWQKWGGDYYTLNFKTAGNMKPTLC